jgi:hypothetical protein
MGQQRALAQAQLQRLQTEYAIELDVLHGALEKGAEQIASMAIR